MKLILNKLLTIKNKNQTLEKGVNYSVKRYNKTYKLLEQHDKKNISDSKVLADSGRLREYIQSLQKAN